MDMCGNNVRRSYGIWSCEPSKCCAPTKLSYLNRGSSSYIRMHRQSSYHIISCVFVLQLHTFGNQTHIDAVSLGIDGSRNHISSSMACHRAMMHLMPRSSCLGHGFWHSIHWCHEIVSRKRFPASANPVLDVEHPASRGRRTCLCWKRRGIWISTDVVFAIMNLNMVNFWALQLWFTHWGQLGSSSRCTYCSQPQRPSYIIKLTRHNKRSHVSGLLPQLINTPTSFLLRLASSCSWYL